jgi:hypothetical protein
LFRGGVRGLGGGVHDRRTRRRRDVSVEFTQLPACLTGVREAGRPGARLSAAARDHSTFAWHIACVGGRGVAQNCSAISKCPQTRTDSPRVSSAVDSKQKCAAGRH